ncbi:MAG: DUF6677 family protein [archaeon]
MAKKNEWGAKEILAIIFSILIPGVGHIILGKTGKGLGILVVSIISIPLMFVIIGFFLYFVLIIYSVIDTVKIANNEK